MTDAPSPKTKPKLKPQHHPEDYGLDVMSGDDDLFRWFLLAYLLGKPIQSTVAVQTWKLFVERGIDTPWAIVGTKEQKLAHTLVEGKYTRYNHVMAKALLTMSQQLIDRYDGSLTLMISLSENETEFGKRLQELYGIGPKTAEIIMRETQEYFADRIE